MQSYHRHTMLLATPHLPEFFVGLLQVIGSLFSFVLPRSLPFFLLAGQLKQGVLAFVVLSLRVNMHSSFSRVIFKVRCSIVTAKDHDFCLCLCTQHDSNVPSSSTAALTRHADSTEQACMWEAQRCMAHMRQLKHDCHGSIHSGSKRATTQVCRPPDLATDLYFLKFSLQPLQVFLQSMCLSLMLLSMLQGIMQISIGLHL